MVGFGRMLLHFPKTCIIGAGVTAHKGPCPEGPPAFLGRPKTAPGPNGSAQKGRGALKGQR